MDEVLRTLHLAITQLENKEVNEAIRGLEEVKEDLEDILNPHWNIQSSDEQYSDPEMWDYEPIYDLVGSTLEGLYSVMFMCSVGEDIDLEDLREEIDSLKLKIKNLD